MEETTHATCDVILRCGASGAVPVHSCILVAVSRFFRRLLGGQAIRRAGQHGLAVGIAGGALDVVRLILHISLLFMVSFKIFLALLLYNSISTFYFIGCW